jgi:hypothetical protein
MKSIIIPTGKDALARNVLGPESYFWGILAKPSTQKYYAMGIEMKQVSR